MQPQPVEEVITPPGGKFEGDILLTPELEKEIEEEDKGLNKRGGGAVDKHTWPENKVYYRLHASRKLTLMLL